MAFANEARRLAADPATPREMTVVLTYLLQSGLGRSNAKPWEMIEAELARHRISMSKNQFQQTLLKETRAGQVFIGSTDTGSVKGYFLIETRADAEAAREFYRRRIDAQTKNLEKLEDLMRNNPLPP